MARFVPISVEVSDSKATPRVRGLKNAFDDVEKSGTKASGGLRNVFDSIGKFAGQAAQKVESSLKQIPATVTKVGSEIKNTLSQIKSHFESTGRESSSAFSQYFSAAFLASVFQRMLSQLIQFGKEFVGKSVELAQDAKNALLGVQSISLFKGIDPAEAQDAIKSLSLVRNGIISVSDASIALKNLLQSGFGLEQSITLIERFGDTAAFGKQAALSYGDAIRSATEGIKNQNSILVDNAGITKNLEVILKERGFHMQDLSDKVKGLAAREALYNGLLAESAGQLGDAAKLTETYTGVVAAQDKAYQDLQRTLGDIIITHPALIESNKIVTEQLNETTAAIQDQDSESAKLADNVIRHWAKIKANLLPFSAFMKNLVQGVFQSILILVYAVSGSVTKVTELLVDSIRVAIGSVLNIFVDGINKITSLARTLPTVPGTPLSVLQSVPTLNRFESGPADLGSASAFAAMNKEITAFTESMKRAVKAADEGIEADRRIDWELNSAAHRREMERRMRALGYDPSAADARVARANELADGVASGGKGKKVADDFKSIANVVPVPTPSDPQLKAMIEEYAGTFGIPLWVAFAQIWTESRFNRNAMSPKGAKGLTQIMPGTAAQVGVSYKNLSDPATALTGWGKIMSSLYTKYGSWDLALLAYHQGEKPVDRLVQIIQRGEVNEEAGGFAAAAKRAGIGPLGRKYLADINLFKSNPVPTEESPFLGMSPPQIVKAVRETDKRGNVRTIDTPDGPLAQLPIQLDREWEKYYKGVGERAQALEERRKELDAEYHARTKDLVTELGNLDIDLQQIRREITDDQVSEQRRLLRARSEEKDLLLSIRDVQDEIATGPYNESLRIQLALLQDIADIRRRDEDAIKSQNRSRLELADAEIFHAQQARDIVLQHLAQSRSQTEIFADALIDAYEGINDAVLQGVQKLTGGIRIVDNLIAGLITRLTNRLFQKLLDVLIPAGPGGGAVGRWVSEFPSTRRRAVADPLWRNWPPAVLQGGSGAGQYLSGGLTPPTTLTAQLAQQAALNGAIQQAGAGGLGSAAAGALLPKAAGFGAAVGGMLPFLGLGVGAAVGGGSRMGQILGGAGGLIAGGIGAAFLAPSLFASTGILGSAGPMIAGLLTNPFTAVAAGALLIGALAFSRNAARRRDERSRNQSMVDSLGQLNQILSAVKSDRMDGSQAIAAAVQVRSQYLSAAGELKDKKTREIAMKDVYRLDIIIGQIRTEADRQLSRRQIDDRLKPEFKTGGDFNSDYFLPQRARSALNLPRAGRGLFELPGTFDRQDDLLMRVSRGERVAVMTPDQYRRIGGRRTFEEAGVPALAGGGFSAPSSSSEPSMPPINLNLNLDLPGFKPGLLLEEMMKTPEGFELFVRLWNKAKKDGRGNVR